MKDAGYLVTGTGSLTGAFTVEQLLDGGQSVRALVDREDATSERLRDLGAEIVLGRLSDPSALARALRGIRRACFAAPADQGLPEAAALFARLAERAGVETLVNLSDVSARPGGACETSRARWLCETVFDESGLDVIHVRPTLSVERLLHLALMIRDGWLFTPFGTGRHAPIDCEDLARVAVSLLVDPGGRTGRTYSIYGAEVLSMDDIAEIAGRVAGAPLKHQQIPVDDYNALVEAHDRPFLRLRPSEILDHTRGVFEGMNQSVRILTGADPLTFGQTMRKHRHVFC